MIMPYKYNTLGIVETMSISRWVPLQATKDRQDKLYNNLRPRKDCGYPNDQTPSPDISLPQA